MPPPEHDRTAILVLGMHRSGTSVLTWLLGAMGAALPIDAIAESGDNRKGYFESRAVVAADDRLIRALRSSWFDLRPLEFGRFPDEAVRAHRADLLGAVAAGFGEAGLFAMKDPRQCRFVPFLAETLAQAGIATRAVILLRDAGEVAASLHARDATVPAYGALLWAQHMLAAERDTRGMERVVVRYDRLLEDAPAVAARLAPLLGRAAVDDALAGRIAEFVDPALRNQRGGVRLEKPLATLVASAQSALARLCEVDGAPERAAVDAVRAAFAEHGRVEGDVLHDELRHRRAPAPIAEPSKSEARPAPPPVARAAPDAPDETAETVRVIRDSGLFDADHYLAAYPDVADAGVDPILHYVTVGAAEGRNPSAHFNTAYYARQLARLRGSMTR